MVNDKKYFNKTDDNDSSDPKKEIPDELDNNRYNRYSRYNKYGKYNRDYYYYDRRYEKKGSLMMSSIIFPITV